MGRQRQKSAKGNLLERREKRSNDDDEDEGEGEGEGDSVHWKNKKRLRVCLFRFVSFRFVSFLSSTQLCYPGLCWVSGQVTCGSSSEHTHTRARTKRRFRLEEYDREGSRAQCPCGLGFRQLGSIDAHAEPRDRISEREKGKGESSRGTYKSEARHTG